MCCDEWMDLSIDDPGEQSGTGGWKLTPLPLPVSRGGHIPAHEIRILAEFIHHWLPDCIKWQVEDLCCSVRRVATASILSGDNFTRVHVIRFVLIFFSSTIERELD